MKLSCLFGHKWNGCKCDRCGTVRDEGHEYKNYQNDKGKCVGRCKCGKRQELEHDWQPITGKCKEECKRCGTQQAKEHNWQRVEGKCIYRCAVCGSERPIDYSEHNWQRVEGKCLEKCADCGKERGIPHTYQRVEGKCAQICSVCGMEKATTDSDHTWEYVEGTCQEKCAVCGKTRSKHDYVNGRCSRCGVQSPEAFMDECVEKLLKIFPTTPLDYEGHKRFDAAHREEVRKIGEELDMLGGMRAMRQVGMEFARRRPIHARKLETTWDGIGNWMG